MIFYFIRWWCYILARYVPCKDCSDRYIGCHSKCDKYALFKLDGEVQKIRRINEIDVDSYYIKKNLKLRDKYKGDYYVRVIK